jgi:hypothetical protein
MVIGTDEARKVAALESIAQILLRIQNELAAIRSAVQAQAKK